jgi:hypothetical protein
MSKEPGQIAYETRFPDRGDVMDEWNDLHAIYKAVWAAVEAAVLEEAAKVAEARDLSIMSSTVADVTARQIAAAIRARAALKGCDT